jgi:hypothetical protein
VVYTIANGSITGAFASKPAKPPNMVTACRALEQSRPNPHLIGDRSLRILIPRVLLALYEIRNNRGVGHVGGDVDPNFLDATAVVAMVSWVLAELVRIFHGISTIEAQGAVDALTERKHPVIWVVDDIKRVLDPSIKMSDQALLLLHQRPAWVAEADLLRWTEYTSASMFRTRVLKPLHKKRLIEFDHKGSRARISPTGAKEVEQRILKSR